MLIDGGELGDDFLIKSKYALSKLKLFYETQFVFCAATFPPVKIVKSKNARAFIEKNFRKLNIVSVNTNNLHSTPEGLVETFIKTSQDIESKFKLLLNHLATGFI